MWLLDLFRRPRADEAAGPAPVREPGRAWAAAPVVQRVVSEPDLVTGPDAFRADLTTWQNPSRDRPRGHHV